jgi:hypothetical protein
LNIRNLLKGKNRHLDDYTCALCNSRMEETIMHLFFECPFDPTLLAHYRHKLEPAITALRHVDHKLNSPRPPCTRPTLVYKGRSDPTEGEDEQKQNKSFVLATNNSSSAPRADPPQEECQELLPSFHHLLPLRRGRDLTANEPRINTE